MILHIGGGYGEHGRNCFLVETPGVRLLFDCGSMAGDPAPHPRLSQEQIGRVDWLFLSHSHEDHIGSLAWLMQQGFRGRVAMTSETARQLPIAVPGVVLLDGLAGPLERVALSEGLEVSWGRSGHCAGSCWLHAETDGGAVLYSGDYEAESAVYAYDKIQNRRADIAILDSAYGRSPASSADLRQAFWRFVGERMVQQKSLLFPVPKHGRGWEMMLGLHQQFPNIPVILDGPLQEELDHLKASTGWLRPQALGMLEKLRHERLEGCAGQPLFSFVSDPQLRQPQARAFAETMLLGGGEVILTGHTDGGGLASRLLRENTARFIRFPAHMNDAGRRGVESGNAFERVIAFHCGEADLTQ